MTKLSDRRTALIAALRRVRDAEGEDRTTALHDAATEQFLAREFFLTGDGSADWAGRSHGYRNWVSDAYAASGVGRDARVQAAVRYHVSNIARQNLTAEELAAANLRDASARERSVEKRAKVAAETAAVRSTNPATTKADILAAAEAAARALRRVRLDELSAEEQAEVAPALAGVADVLCELAA